jgi:hypothetical protein
MYDSCCSLLGVVGESSGIENDESLVENRVEREVGVAVVAIERLVPSFRDRGESGHPIGEVVEDLSASETMRRL